MAKPPKKITPEWLDEDPEEQESQRSKDHADFYGAMTDASKFHGKNSDAVKPDDRHEAKSLGRQSVAQFCGTIGARYEGDAAVLDLHGMRLSAALTTVDRVINAIIDDGRVKRLRIITGRGNHSDEGVGVLARDVHPHVEQTYAKSISSIDVSPAELIVRGFPARGHFDVRFK